MRMPAALTSRTLQTCLSSGEYSKLGAIICELAGPHHLAVSGSGDLNPAVHEIRWQRRHLPASLPNLQPVGESNQHSS